MTLGAGSIAFVGFNAENLDNLAFVVLEPITAGTQIHFTDDEWLGDAFSTGESRFTWTATSDIAAGSVVRFDGLASATPTSNLGTLAFTAGATMNVDTANEMIYAYVGTPAAPTAFLAAIANDTFTQSGGTLNGTGLTLGLHAVSFNTLDNDADIAAYNGPRGNLTNFSDFLPLINNPANWVAQDLGGFQDADGIPPDAPFPLDSFISDPTLQTVSFAADSLVVSQAEGDSGTTLLTFTVERANGTTGDLTFSGAVQTQLTVNAADFGGTLPATFGGTIPEGASSTTVTIAVSGDMVFEGDESFQLTLQSATNTAVPAVVSGTNKTATATIADDDIDQVHPVDIAFVGFNNLGNDNLAFVALQDISAGTIIHFTDNEWTGASFNTGENHWSWTATSDISAGTIVTLDDLSTATPTSNLGTIEFATNATRNIDASEIVYAYAGAPNIPGYFLAAISNNNFGNLNATLEGTGLTIGETAISTAVTNNGADIFEYAGPRVGEDEFTDYLPLINDPSNWITQDDVANTQADGVPPEVPFSPSGFAVDPNTQIVEFATESLNISHAEGDSGTVSFTFTVERTGSTQGDLAFSGSVTSLAANGADFGGALPTFSGTIPDGAPSAEVTITVAGDTLPEIDETFYLHLESVSNDSAPAIIGSDNVATGTIVGNEGVPSIAFVGYNRLGTDNLAFVALSDITAGTVIHFTDNEWNGSAFNTGESTWSWTAISDIKAGTVVTMDHLNTTATSNLGTIAFSESTARGLDDTPNSSEAVYAYVGAPGSPTAFVTAIANNGFFPGNGVLDGTGLVVGQSALSLAFPGLNNNDDITAYNGPHTGVENFSDFLPLINDPANWISQSFNSFAADDGIAPDAPFAPAGFAVDPDTQFVEFAPGSLSISQAEGDSGTTTFTFTVERSGSTTGAVNFSGAVTSLKADGADFGGSLPTFSGTIPDGATSVQITITATGDTLAETDEKFKVALHTASNAEAPVALGADSLASGTITNDDAKPFSIAFTGWNADGAENLAFVAIGDIAAGTEIHFTENRWDGTKFLTGEANWTWTATSDIAAGTIVTMDGLAAGQTATSNLGTIVYSDETGRGLSTGWNNVYAYTGTPTSPNVFLAAMTNEVFGPTSTVFDTRFNGVLTNTGLTLGVDAIALDTFTDVNAYVGPRVTAELLDIASRVNDPANWISQSGSGDQSSDGTAPDVPFSTIAFTLNPTLQTVSFAVNSLNVSLSEGNVGTTTFTFIVERTGGSTPAGNLDFSGTFSPGSTDAADFGGSLPPLTFSGTILDGQTTAEVTITVSGDVAFEGSESFTLTLDTVSNATEGAILGAAAALTATGTIVSDESDVIANGESVAGSITLSGADTLVIEQGGTLTGQVVFETPLTGALVDNAGLIDGDGGPFSLQNGGGESAVFTITNQESGVILGGFRFSGDLDPQAVTINNAGRMTSSGTGIDVNNIRNGLTVVNNFETGVIESGTGEAMRGGIILNNWGVVRQIGGTEQHAVDGNGREGFTVNNYGRIEASKHATTNDEAGSVFNGVDGVMIGHSGSAVNWDNDTGLENAVHVTNYGVMEGRSAGAADQDEDSDGDAVDVDGLAFVDNYGSIRGLGQYGYHNGEPNVSEGIAMGGGTISNYAGATIYGYGRAIQVDDSGNGQAFAATTITNEGTIEGGGNAAIGVDPSDAILYDPINGEAINIVGGQNDTLINKGNIIGGVKMGGGDDTLTNAGTMTATGGSAVNMGDGADTLTHSGTISGDVLMGAGDDTVTLVTEATIASVLDGGDGVDTLHLTGSGEGTLGAIAGFETIHVIGGAWSLGDEGAAVVFEDGAQTLRLASSLLADGAFAGTIKGFGQDDVIDLQGIGLATSAVLGPDNVLTITGGANGPITLQLDPEQDFTGKGFRLSSDGEGGTSVTLDLGPGAIAFVGFNAFGGDNLAFVALTDIAAGTTIQFTDKAWNGSDFEAGESAWSWTAAGDVAAGSVVTMDGLSAGHTAVSNLGTIAFSDETARDFDYEVIYAYVGTPGAPSNFLTALSNVGFQSSFGSLEDTGLVEGETALNLVGYYSDVGIGVYAGPVANYPTFDDYRTAINNPANWVVQDNGNDQSGDGTAPDLPFDVPPFTVDVGAQLVQFSADSVALSEAEGDAGSRTLTFTVVRSGGTNGALEFSGSLTAGKPYYGGFYDGGTLQADDLGGNLPTAFSGTIADGEASATVTITIAGDTHLEIDEAFTLRLQSGVNPAATVAVGPQSTATGTIIDDDDAPHPEIAIVGLNGSGSDSLAFVALDGIASGTTIQFSSKTWNIGAFEDDPASPGSTWTWTASGNIAAGSVVTLDALDGMAPTSNHGTVVTSGGGELYFHVYAYLGEPDRPTAFLTAFTTETFTGNSLSGTGLAENLSAVELQAFGEVAAYDGPRSGFADTAAIRTAVRDNANWVYQNSGADQASGDGVRPDAPFSVLPFTTDPSAQIVGFAAAAPLSQMEGNDGTVAFTFTIARSGGTVGAIEFTGVLRMGSYAEGHPVSANDFGGATPTFSGTIAEGETSTTVTVTVTGDTTFELDETFVVELLSISNSAGQPVGAGKAHAEGTIINDDTPPSKIASGEVLTATIDVTGNDHFVVEPGGKLIADSAAFNWKGTGTSVVIDNAGFVQSGNILEVPAGTSGALVFNNLAGGTVDGNFDPSSRLAGGTTVTINNAGTITGNDRVVDFHDAVKNGALVTINNLAGGLITQRAALSDMIRPGANTVINNAGTIMMAADPVGSGSDAIDYQGNVGGQVNNLAGGWIEASRHAITGDRKVVVVNEAGATMIGRNGSAVNIDNNSSIAETVHVTNRGTMLGRSANLDDSDGDAIDTDGLAAIENYGSIRGEGHNGYHDGEPNVSEGIAIGGGTINNYAGAEIYGYGRAIQVDNSENGPAFAAITIYNEGLIQGDGNAPTGVDQEDVAPYTPNGNEAVNIVGNHADTLTNKGQIIGGVAMGGGDDTVNLYTGSSINGVLNGGEGNDTLNLLGDGEGTVGDLEGIETVNLVGGAWTFNDEGAGISFDEGAQTLRIAGSALADGAFAGTIKGFGQGDAIGLQGIGLATSAVLGPDNVLTIAGGANGPITLQLDPEQDFTGMKFVLGADGAGGTTVRAVAGGPGEVRVGNVPATTAGLIFVKDELSEVELGGSDGTADASSRFGAGLANASFDTSGGGGRTANDGLMITNHKAADGTYHFTPVEDGNAAPLWQTEGSADIVNFYLRSDEAALSKVDIANFVHVYADLRDTGVANTIAIDRVERGDVIGGSQADIVDVGVYSDGAGPAPDAEVVEGDPNLPRLNFDLGSGDDVLRVGRATDEFGTAPAAGAQNAANPGYDGNLTEILVLAGDGDDVVDLSGADRGDALLEAAGGFQARSWIAGGKDSGTISSTGGQIVLGGPNSTGTWTAAGVSLLQVQDITNPNETPSAISLDGANPKQFAGGDLFNNDLGVSGVSLSQMATISQEIDGKEALIVDLGGNVALSATFGVSQLWGAELGAWNDWTKNYYEAGRVQAFDAAGNLVAEETFLGVGPGKVSNIRIDSDVGFSSLVFTAGLYDGETFIYGGYAKSDGSFAAADFKQLGQKDGSDFLIDSLTIDTRQVIVTDGGDLLTGSTGGTTYLYEQGDGVDHITNFTGGRDQIDLIDIDPATITLAGNTAIFAGGGGLVATNGYLWELSDFV